MCFLLKKCIKVNTTKDSATVIIGRKSATRTGDLTTHGKVRGSSTVLIGD